MVALLAAFAAAPHSHVHRSIDDEHHSATETVRHAHVTAHPHQDEGEAHERAPQAPANQNTWRIDDFVFQPVVAVHAPLPLLIEVPATHSPLVLSWRAAAHFHPEAHGPPPICSCSLRAPPACLPSFL